MSSRRRRVSMLVMCLIIAVGVVSAAVWSAVGHREAITRSHLIEKDVDEDTSPPNGADTNAIPAPFVRQPIPREPGFAPVPIAVEIGHDLQPIGPNKEHEVRTYAEVVLPRSPDQLNVRIGITNGLGGVNADILLDPKTKSGQVVVMNCYDIAPFYRPWSDVRGVVRITSWSLRVGTLFEIDLHGKAEGTEGDLHLCAPLLVRSLVPVREDHSGFR
jgi:hypothetical protein